MNKATTTHESATYESVAAADRESKLLFWMSHKGVVGKNALRNALSSLEPNGDEERRRTDVNTIRRRLLELGHADPLDPALNEWRILPPYLTTLPALPTMPEGDGAGRVLLCGGRTPAFLTRVSDAATETGLTLVPGAFCGSSAPPRLAFAGAPNALQKFAESLDVPLINAAPRRIIESARGGGNAGLAFLQAAVVEPQTPTKAECERWNWLTWAWEAGRTAEDERDGALLRVTVGYGPKPHLVRYQNRWRRVMSEPQAQYLSAGLRHIPLARHDAATSVLQLFLRPPYDLARPLCLCSGCAPERVASATVPRARHAFVSVPPLVAREWARAFGVGLELV